MTLSWVASRWELLPGRLPVGNHDHFLCEASGTLWLAGGLTHFRSYPARLHVFDELFSFDKAQGGWSSVPMPAPRCYNGLAALENLIFVIGGAAPQGDPQPLPKPPMPNQPAAGA